MLVLSRKLGEKIFIGDNICITVVDIDRGKIRLGIEAPRDVPIYRQELLPLNQMQARTDAACIWPRNTKKQCIPSVEVSVARPSKWRAATGVGMGVAMARHNPVDRCAVQDGSNAMEPCSWASRLRVRSFFSLPVCRD